MPLIMCPVSVHTEYPVIEPGESPFFTPKVTYFASIVDDALDLIFKFTVVFFIYIYKYM